MRTYYELRGIRDILNKRSDGLSGVLGKVPVACEIGCGYGRITPVLGEFAHKVVGFEREPDLIAMAKVVVRDVDFIKIDKLQDVEKYGRFDLVMICTVLQHLSDPECAAVLKSIVAILRPGGYALIIESTDVEKLELIGQADDGSKFLSRPRSESYYIYGLSPLVCVARAERVLERSFVTRAGSVLLLRK